MPRAGGAGERGEDGAGARAGVGEVVYAMRSMQCDLCLKCMLLPPRPAPNHLLLLPCPPDPGRLRSGLSSPFSTSA